MKFIQEAYSYIWVKQNPHYSWSFRRHCDTIHFLSIGQEHKGNAILWYGIYL
jgi:hypothetical protein